MIEYLNIRLHFDFIGFKRKIAADLDDVNIIVANLQLFFERK